MNGGNPGILQTWDPKIDTTSHRGVRHHKNPSLHPAYLMAFLDSIDTLIF